MKTLIVFIDHDVLYDALEDTDLDNRVMQALNGKTFPTQSAFEHAYSGGLTQDPNELAALLEAVSWYDTSKPESAKALADTICKAETDYSELGNTFAAAVFIGDTEEETERKLKIAAFDKVFPHIEELEDVDEDDITPEYKVQAFDWITVNGLRSQDQYAALRNAIAPEWETHSADWALDFVFTIMSETAIRISS